MTKPVTRKMVVDWFLWHVIAIGARPTCICGKYLEPGDDIQWDHIHADVFDGPHEYQNLRPLHAECHRKKTASDIKDNAKVKRLRGEGKPKKRRQWPSRKIPSRPFKASRQKA